jgi:hypothetical protein
MVQAPPEALATESDVVEAGPGHRMAQDRRIEAAQLCRAALL